MLHEALALALASGGDYADIFIERSSPQNIVLEDDRIEKVLTGTTLGAGIRVIFGGMTAYATTDDLSADNMLEIARRLSRAVGGKKAGAVSAQAAPLYNEVPSAHGTQMKDKVALLKEANRAARGRHQSVRQVSAIFRGTRQEVQVAASTGEAIHDIRLLSTGIVNVVAAKGNIVQTGYEPISGTCGFDELFKNHSLMEAALSAADRANELLGARPAPGGRMPVVIAAEAGGTMIHEAIGHGLEGDLAGQDLSKFSGMLGKQVASPLISVIDDPTLKGRRGSYAFDDEGVRAKRNVLVQEGVLKGYMHDRLSATRMGVEPTGNGRRESYHSLPIPRMSNTFIAPASPQKATAPKTIIASVDRGLLVRRMGGGQVNTVNGDFVFDVGQGYIIEKGKVGELVRGATLTGNGPAILMNIDMLADDLGFAIGTCGKDGQGVPVSDAMPTLRIPDIVVGGSQGS